ncbi:MAG: hypothetical protein IKQ60_08090 [Candidatus Methanomethylophilaceae archaeon]|nr:hypothetical protein [Candidatus Methanomethylophilaceae archaeon]
MKVSRFAKATAVMATMAACGILCLYFTVFVQAAGLRLVVPAVVAFIGAAACGYETRNSLKGVIAAACFFAGLFLILASFFGYAVINDVVLSAAGVFTGLVYVILGFSVWCGYDFGMIGIRYVYAFFIAFQIIGFWTYARLIHMIVDARLMSVIVFTVAMEAAILLLALDKSLGDRSEAAMSKHNLRTHDSSLANTEDGYILRRYGEGIQRVLHSDGMGRVATRMFSSRHGDKWLELVKDASGRSLLTISEAVGGSTLMSMDVADSSMDEGSLTLYGSGGQWTRLLVYDTVQEDMAKPKLFGRELGRRPLKAIEEELEKESSVEIEG